MTAPTPLKVDWVDKDTPGHTAPDWSIPAAVHNNIGAWVNYLNTQLGGKQAAHALLTAISALVDPNTDKLIFWDDSAGTLTYLTLGTNLSITGTTLNATAGGSPGSTDAVPEGTTNLYYTNARADARVVAGITGKQPLNANLTSISTLVDPNADRLAFWDDSAGAWAFLTLGTNLSITGTTLNATGGGGSGDVVGPASSTDNAIARYDLTTGKLLQTSLASVDDSGNVSALNTLLGFATTVTAAGTTTLTVASPRTQEFTGTTTQTVRLPTTGVPQGAAWRVINNSTGNVTVQSSGANSVLVMGPGTTAEFTAKQATPTTAAHWSYAAPLRLTTTGTSGAATLIANTLNIPQYAGGGGTPNGFENVMDYGANNAYPTPTTSSGNAFRAAAAVGPVWVPAGEYLFDGAGIGGFNPVVVGADAQWTRINVGAGVWFIDSTEIFDSLRLEKLKFIGGAGYVRSTKADIAVAGYRNIVDNEFYDYTVCAIGHRNTDSPYWHIQRNVFQAANFNTTIGIALNGLTDSCNIIDNDFHVNRVAIKLWNGANCHVERNAFLRFDVIQSFPRIDVWLLPGPAGGSDLGTGFTCVGNKFGNELLDPADYKIVYADAAAGNYESTFPLLTTPSTGYMWGHVIENNYHVCDAASPTPLVYSTIPGDQMFLSRVGPNVQMGATAIAPFLRLLNANNFNGVGNNHMIGPVQTYIDDVTRAPAYDPSLFTFAAGSPVRWPTGLGQTRWHQRLQIVADATARSTGLGTAAIGIRIPEPLRIVKAVWRSRTADASGNLVVDLRKNGTAVSGTSTTIAAANQVAGGTATGNWIFAAGDILTSQITGVGTTPGQGLVVDLEGDVLT